jgi:hypothetical protein
MFAQQRQEREACHVSWHGAPAHVGTSAAQCLTAMRLSTRRAEPGADRHILHLDNIHTWGLLHPLGYLTSHHHLVSSATWSQLSHSTTWQQDLPSPQHWPALLHTTLPAGTTPSPPANHTSRCPLSSAPARPLHEADQPCFTHPMPPPLQPCLFQPPLPRPFRRASRHQPHAATAFGYAPCNHTMLPHLQPCMPHSTSAPLPPPPS